MFVNVLIFKLLNHLYNNLNCIYLNVPKSMLLLVWHQNYFNMSRFKITAWDKERLLESFQNEDFLSTAGILEIKRPISYFIIRTYIKTKTITSKTRGGFRKKVK